MANMAVFCIPIAAVVVILFFLSYKKVPKNKIGIVIGPLGSKTVTGRAVLVVPFFQRIDYMTLENIQVDFVSKAPIPTQDAINIMVDAVANVAISQDSETMKKAAAKFVGYQTSAIAEIVKPVLEGNIREIISQIKLKDLIQGDKKKLAEEISANVKPNLADLGLELTTFNIQNFKDSNGVIDNLGIENTVSISKDAAKAKASAEAEIQIAKAQADKDANDARVAAELEIAQKQTDLKIKQAELLLKSDTEAAKAEAAKSLEAENQRKALEIRTAEANLARQEKQIELQEKAVAIKEKALEAEIEKTAEAERYAAEQRADAELYAREKSAEAAKIEQQKKSEAARIAMENEALGKMKIAEAIKAQGEAEAQAIRAKLEAEAAGLEKKAVALAKMNDAGTLQMQLDTVKTYFEKLPDIAKGVAAGYANVDKIYLYGGNASALQENITQSIVQVSEGLSNSCGVDVKALLNGLTQRLSEGKTKAGE